MKRFLENVLKLFSHSEEGHEEKVCVRNSISYGIVALLMLIEIGVLYINSGINEGLNKHADEYRQAAVAEADAKTIAAGDVYDRNETLLVLNEKPGEDSVYTDSYAYSQVIGYTGPTKIVKGTQVSEAQRDYRLLAYLRDQIYKTVNIDGIKGNSIYLTLDHKLQMKVMELLLAEVDNDMQQKASAVVMNAKTGEVLAMVSFPTFNANNISESIDMLNNSNPKDELMYPVSHKGLEVPGSIFKIVIATSLLDNGMKDFVTQDLNFFIDGVNIVNDYTSLGDTINYHQAMVRSSNVFFAKAGLELGGDKLEETAKKFMIGEYVETDFGSINSFWKLDTDSDSNIAQTAFGQGNTLYSTMTATMITQAIANDGVMNMPYMVQEIRNANGKTVYEGEEEKLSEVTSEETANKITDAMVATTEDHIRMVENEEAKEIYKKYLVASKTGTGENENDSNNAWFVSFAPADDPEYVVVVNQMDTNKYGYRMMDTAAEIYRYLFEQKQ